MCASAGTGGEHATGRWSPVKERREWLEALCMAMNELHYKGGRLPGLDQVSQAMATTPLACVSPEGRRSLWVLGLWPLVR